MKIGYLGGTGVWGFTLASLLAGKGYEVVAWSIEEELVHQLNKTKEHPRLQGSPAEGNIRFTTDLKEALANADFLVESVTVAGVRPVFEQINTIGLPNCPIVLTSKGIEQKTGLTTSEIICNTVGEEIKPLLSSINGPSFATEVVQKLPTSVVCAAYEREMMMEVTKIFTTDTFRVYPNMDMRGVSLCSALKNVIAIACGVAEGLELGQGCKSSLMTRGLHEMAKLVVARGGTLHTVYGLAGMGDLCLTCSSIVSRNCHFGFLLAQGKSPSHAREKIGMVVEGSFTAKSALELSQKLNIPMPITESVYDIVYNDLKPKDVVVNLMHRAIKDEYL